jgi:NAD(P)-dependent dehydrogenase (short-subunit alcohol dehydrogenase family)
VACVWERWGRIDVLINNAAEVVFEKFERISLDQLDSIFRTNLVAPFVLSQRVAERMKASGGGQIINISSAYGLTGVAGATAYAASKAAVIAMSDCMRRELRSAGIQVNVICPVGIRVPGDSPRPDWWTLLSTVSLEQFLCTLERTLKHREGLIWQAVPMFAPLESLRFLRQAARWCAAGVIQSALWLRYLFGGF